MLGAIAGDIIGSVYESSSGRTKSEDFPLFSTRSRFTDDTVLTVAVAAAILEHGDYGTSIREYARRYPHAGYGWSFKHWMLSEDMGPYGSYGNGSAMRVSPVGWAFQSEEDVLREAERSAAVTHNHPEGIKGAQAVALAIFLARRGAAKKEIKDKIEVRFGYDLDRSIAAIRPGYRFDVSCQGSVPEALIAFLESDGVESAIRKAVSLGGDADTMAAIAGSVAEAAFRDMPDEITININQRLPQDFRDLVARFYGEYISKR